MFFQKGMHLFTNKRVLFKGKYLRKNVFSAQSIMQVCKKNVHAEHASSFNGCNIPPVQCFMYTRIRHIRNMLYKYNLKFKNAGSIMQKNVRIRSIPLKDAAVSSRCAMSETHNFHLRDAVLVCRQKDA